MLKDRESQLKMEIQHRQASLEDVQSALFNTINKANEIQNLLAPVSRLPNEVLLLIFEEVVSAQNGGKPADRPERVVSLVSRRWRDVAIHSPSLWRRIWIMPGFTPAILDMYKTRASSRTLDIEVRDWREKKDIQRFDAALEMMLEASTRWRSLSVFHTCETYLNHLSAKLSRIRQFSVLEHFSFRAQRPGQTCTIPFHKSNETSAPFLKFLDAENFPLSGDLHDIRSGAIQNLSRLASLTLRRYNNNTRIMIDPNAFRAMIGAIPNLTSLALHGQPLRFRNDSSLLDGVDAPPPPPITLPHLHTLILLPSIFKPRYLHKTLSLLSAPTLRHFELVFPDSKISGQNIVNFLFFDHHPMTTTTTTTKRPKFPLVHTLVLHNVASASTAMAFVHAFPAASNVSIGGVDVGFFLPVLRAPGVVGDGYYDCSSASAPLPLHVRESSPHASWHNLRTLTLRSIRPDTLRIMRDWIRDEWERGRMPPALVVKARQADRGPDLTEFCQCVRMYTRVDVVYVDRDVPPLLPPPPPHTG
ncbi:hypothetical protein F5I97DRAFT_1506648 [Phlebopus sp. FC_14]|nr:hypothetical protein F5I97DRAFT_1506648 [Phlebopus sp. FC_14]